MVAQDFLPSGAWNVSFDGTIRDNFSGCDPNGYRTPSTEVPEIFHAFQQQGADLQRLDDRDCFKTFTNPTVMDHASVLLISDANSSFQSGWASWEANVLDDNWTPKWPCLGLSNCSGVECAAQISYAESSWVMPLLADKVTIDYCVALQSRSVCTVNVSRILMSAVIFCTVIKLSCFVWMLFLSIHEPLITIGDVIASFIRDRDKTTNHQSSLSYRDVSSGRWARNDQRKPQRWTDDAHFWITVFDRLQYAVTMLWHVIHPTRHHFKQ